MVPAVTLNLIDNLINNGFIILLKLCLHQAYSNLLPNQLKFSFYQHLLHLHTKRLHMYSCNSYAHKIKIGSLFTEVFADTPLGRVQHCCSELKGLKKEKCRIGTRWKTCIKIAARVRCSAGQI